MTLVPESPKVSDLEVSQLAKLGLHQILAKSSWKECADIFLIPKCTIV